MSKRIAVLVSGGGTNLQALIDAQRQGELGGGRICAIIASKPGVYALERAKQAGIPGYVVARKDYSSAQAFTAALVDKLRTLGIDLVVLAGFMVILTSEMVEAFPNAILNVHPALIPSFCGEGCYGLHVHEKALEYGAEGVIIESMKFCEYWGYERAQDAAWLTEGFALPGTLPVCQIERDYTCAASGQLRTRFQAFVESLEIKRIQAAEQKEGA